MQFLADHFRPVTLSSLLDMLSGDSSADSRAVVVTFDDGYSGVVSHALPVLEALGIHPAVFVVTDHTPSVGDAEPFHFDELELAFRLTTVPCLRLEELGLAGMRLDSIQRRAHCLKESKRRLKRCPEHERARWHTEILGRLEVDRQAIRAHAGRDERYRLCSWDELRKAALAGVAVGSHTCTHRALSQLPRLALEHEIQESLAAVRRELGESSVALAYPYGALEHVGTEAPEIARDAGYSCALTTIGGSNRAGVDRFMLRRVEFRDLEWYAS